MKLYLLELNCYRYLCVWLITKLVSPDTLTKGL